MRALAPPDASPVRGAGVATPVATDEGDAGVAAAERARRSVHGSLEASGRWILERAAPDDARVWEVEGDTVQLRARIERGDPRFFLDDAIVVEDGAGLVFVDLAGRAIHAFPRARLLASGAGFVFVGTADTAARLTWPGLRAAGEVTWTEPRGAPAAVVLAGGAVLAFDGSLVSFDARRALATGLAFGEASANGRRIAACDEASRTMLDVDAVTGALGRRFATAGSSCALGTLPAYAPDARFLVWFEPGRMRADHVGDTGAAMIVAVGDTQTGSVRRFEDPVDGWGTSSSARASVDPASARMCASLSSSHWRWRYCDWKVLADGTIERSPAPPVARTPFSVPGRTEIARATSPDGKRVAVLSYVKAGDAKRDLELTLVRADGGAALRTVVLAAGDFAMDDQAVGLGDTPAPGTMPPLPRLVFFDARHVGLIPGAYGFPFSRLVDVDTGATSRLCDDPPQPDGTGVCELVGRFASSGRGELLDPLTGRRLALTASDGAWAAALRVPPP